MIDTPGVNLVRPLMPISDLSMTRSDWEAAVQVAPGRCGICRSSAPVVTPLDNLDCIYSRADNTILVRPGLPTRALKFASCIHPSCMLAASYQCSEIRRI